MRLLKREKSGWLPGNYKFSIKEFVTGKIPKYAILSHRWGEEEVTFPDLQAGNIEAKAGYKKLDFCAEQAEKDGLLYFWIDTCCIDKSNNTELTEAINSMFKWYNNADKCYVYLSDVSQDDWESTFKQSEWFTRGWTLQELIAPTAVDFFSKEGKQLGEKHSLSEQLHHITGISVDVLKGAPLSTVDKQERFSWAAIRRTTKEEDTAYCLLGIFDVHMPLIYGEGQQKALARLRREIQLLSRANSFVADHAPWIVPFERNSNFTGREPQLVQLEGRIFSSHHNTMRLAVVGLGGVGKTQLVLELLYRLKKKEPDVTIIWIPAVTTESLDQAYINVVRQLDIPGCDDPDTDTKQLLQDYLSKDTARRWLLVFDNADDIDMWTLPMQQNALGNANGSAQCSSLRPRRLLDYLPRSKDGCILFTTRDRKAAISFAQQNIITISELSEETALQLFKKSLVTPKLADSCDEMSNLLSILTYLPLAIIQAAAYINTNNVTLAEYSSILQDTEQEIIEILSDDFEDLGRYQNIKNPIATTWLISFERIQQQNPLAAEYLSFIACINFKDIPQYILPPGPSRKKELDAMGTLNSYSFISRRPGDDAFDVHRLVHLSMRKWLRKEGKLKYWTEKTIEHLGEKALATCNVMNVDRRQAYIRHAASLLHSDVIGKDNRNMLDWMLICGQLYKADGRFDEALAVLQELANISSTNLGNDHDETLFITSLLAQTNREVGNYSEAQQLSENVLKVYQTKRGLDHEETIAAMHNLGVVYVSQGSEALFEAEKIFLQLIEVYNSKSEFEEEEYLIVLSNLALVYSYQARFVEAEQIQRRVIEASKRFHSPDARKMITATANLGHTLISQGRYHEGEQQIFCALENSKLRLGADHLTTLAHMNSLGLTYFLQGRLKEAKEMLTQTAELRKSTSGDQHPDTLDIIHNLALVYQKEDCTTEAEPLLLHVVESMKTKYGVDHPSTMRFMCSLGVNYIRQARFNDAEELLHQVVDLQLTKLGNDHLETLLSIKNLAMVYHRSGLHDKAEKLLQPAFELMKTKYRLDHPLTLSIMVGLADIWKSLHRREEAVQLLKECVERSKCILGTTHPEFLMRSQILRMWEVELMSGAIETDIEQLSLKI